METPNEMRMKIVGKATGDADFRAQLLSDPKGTIRTGVGGHHSCVHVGEVHEESGAAAHLILPPASKLSESDLQAVAGGARPRGQEWDPRTW